MTVPAGSPESLSDKGPMRLRLSPEQHAGLEFVMDIMPGKYPTKASVLDDYSLNACMEMRRRSRELAGVVESTESSPA